MAPLSRRQQSAAALATYALLSFSLLGLQAALPYSGRRVGDVPVYRFRGTNPADCA